MKHKWTIAIIIIILAGIGFSVFKSGEDSAEITENNIFNSDFGEQLKIEEDSQLGTVTENIGDSIIDSEIKSQSPLHYTNEKYNFSFNYPSDVTASFFKEGEGDMVLIQSSDTSRFAQIFIIPFDEPEPISKKRILKDLPNIVIKNEQKGTVGGHPAVAFLGRHETLGNTYEIWFTRNLHLYQIMTKESTAQFLINIIKTWTE